MAMVTIIKVREKRMKFGLSSEGGRGLLKSGDFRVTSLGEGAGGLGP